MHGHLREVHAKLARTEAELQAVAQREAEQREQLAARDEQLALSRAKLRSSAGSSKGQQGQVHAPHSPRLCLAPRRSYRALRRSRRSTARYTGLWQVEALAESANAAREELRVKGEQLALMRQSTQVLEQENLAKEQQAEVLRERQALLERELAAKDDELMLLSEQLQTSQMEIKVGGSQLGRRNEGLQLELGRLKKSLAEAEARADALQRESARLQRQAEAAALGQPAPTGGAPAALVPASRTFFHNTCLLVKLLLSQSQTVSNVPIDDLYEEVRRKALPMDDWPMFIYSRVSAEP